MALPVVSVSASAAISSDFIAKTFVFFGRSYLASTLYMIHFTSLSRIMSSTLLFISLVPIDMQR